MPPRRNTNIESITDEYIDSAVKVHVKASDVPPRENLNISFADADKLGDEVTLSNQEAYEESHGKLYDMTHNNTVPWRNWAFYLILLSMLTVCFTFAKYASFASGSGSATVAKFNIEVTGTASQTTDVTVKIGETSIVGAAHTMVDNETINVVFGANSPENAVETITFTVTNNSDVTVKIMDADWSNTSSGKHHTVTPTIITQTDIRAGDSGTVTVSIAKFGEALSGDSGTLTIQVDQVD